jgi:UDP-N-acetylglucosamine--N-acetylmuramyl-(pentapeptide) pyrophosphoryl-undecaprenol N-acetylglucosamine transferase
MADAMAAADLVLCRSGASVLGELPIVGTPAALVPLPDPKVHQYENAAYLERHGAAIILREEELGERLGTTLTSLLDDESSLKAMADACRSLARPGAATAIAQMVLKLAVSSRTSALGDPLTAEG